LQSKQTLEVADEVVFELLVVVVGCVEEKADD